MSKIISGVIDPVDCNIRITEANWLEIKKITLPFLRNFFLPKFPFYFTNILYIFDSELYFFAWQKKLVCCGKRGGRCTLASSYPQVLKTLHERDFYLTGKYKFVLKMIGNSVLGVIIFFPWGKNMHQTAMLISWFNVLYSCEFFFL